MDRANQTIWQNSFYTEKAIEMIDEIERGKSFLSHHRPSMGSWGESLLRNALCKILPERIKVTQGFICKSFEDKGISSECPQCDIILYNSNYEPLSFGEISIVSYKAVFAVIEVKTSIKRASFERTIKNFEKLYSKYGVKCMYLFIFNGCRPQTIEKYFYPLLDMSIGEYTIGEPKYDYGNFNELPHGIISLRENYYLRKDYVVTERDMIGYAAYEISYHTKELKTSVVSCLQLFLADLFHKLGNEILYKDDDNQVLDTLERKYAFGLFNM